MSTMLEDRPEHDDPDDHYLIVPEHVWHREAAPAPDSAEDAEDTEDTELDDDDLYYLDREPKPLGLNAFTGLGGAAGSIVFGVVAGAVASSPVGLVAGVAAGIFGGLMGRSVAEEFYDRKHEPDH